MQERRERGRRDSATVEVIELKKKETTVAEAYTREGDKWNLCLLFVFEICVIVCLLAQAYTREGEKKHGSAKPRHSLVPLAKARELGAFSI